MFLKLMPSGENSQYYYVNEKLNTNVLDELFYEKRIYFNDYVTYFNQVLHFMYHLICSANPMTGFYVKCNTGLKSLKEKGGWVRNRMIISFVESDFHFSIILTSPTRVTSLLP